MFSVKFGKGHHGTQKPGKDTIASMLEMATDALEFENDTLPDNGTSLKQTSIRTISEDSEIGSQNLGSFYLQSAGITSRDIRAITKRDKIMTTEITIHDDDDDVDFNRHSNSSVNGHEATQTSGRQIGELRKNNTKL